MSNSRLQNLGKPPTVSGQTIGFRFLANEEQLIDLQSQCDSNDKSETDVEKTSTSFACAKSEEDKSEPVGDAVKDYWFMLGRRSTSIDSTYESPFSNPIETWKKINELRGKFTKTVSEMKIDRNLLGKSNSAKLISSKENSSISDSEDTSSVEDQNLLPSKAVEKETDDLTNTEVLDSENIQTEEKQVLADEIRNRKSSSNLSEFTKIPEIKIAAAKSEGVVSMTEGNIVEDVESCIEANENFNPIPSESFDFCEEDITPIAGDGSQNPPPGGTECFVSYANSILSRTASMVLIVGISFYMFFPMPEFLRGFLLCFLLMVVWKKIKIAVQGEETFFPQTKHRSSQDLKPLPPLKVPHYKPVKGVWINEYERDSYDPDYYSVTHTVPAYLELNNNILKLSRPKGKIHRRATFDEPEYKLNFISQRIYNISGCNVFLLPEGLTRRRLFSKKYPIVIFLRPDSLISEKRKGKSEDRDAQDGSDVEDSSIAPLESTRRRNSLYLFTRCDRQKEEWYRRILSATKLSSSPIPNRSEKLLDIAEENENLEESSTKEPHTPFENLFFDGEAALNDEYLRYMAKFVDSEVIPTEIKIKKRQSSSIAPKKIRSKKKDITVSRSESEPHKFHSVSSTSERDKSQIFDDLDEESMIEEASNVSVQVQWFNAFLNRILFDVFRSPYWLGKIHDKIEKKLNSVRFPFYVEDIELTEMDLGKSGPIFHRVSQPYIDERGLWFDMDTTFDGLIKITIQTQLNLVKLQKGMEEDSEPPPAHEKPEKGKKKEKEVKNELNKESKKKSKENGTKTPEVLGEEPSCSKSQSTKFPTVVESERSLDCRSLDDSKLLDEVVQLAKIAVEESLGGNEKRSPIYDSELEDSAESTEEDGEHPEVPEVAASQKPAEQKTKPVSQARRYPRDRKSSKSIFRVFENVAQSKYFKSVAQSKYVQKAIANVSATKLSLTIEIKECNGILTINIPPPPSDRFWLGFREMPKVVITVHPKIGEKNLRFANIKNFLYKKILHELKAKMVQPNMIPIICPALAREELTPTFFNTPNFKIPEPSGILLPNMVDFVLPTSSPPRSSSSLQVEEPETDEQEVTQLE